MTMTPTPLQVEVWRGPYHESTHPVDAVVVDAAGTKAHVWGESMRPVIPRSAIKSIQALPLILSGAAEEHAVTDDELALACSSHSGEADHVAAVTAWLERIGAGTETLECGPDRPINADAAAQLTRTGAADHAVYNCCSGKHAGFITTAATMGVSATGYITPNHAVQLQVREAITTMTGANLSDEPNGIDGCGIPVYALPLHQLALGMARLVDPTDVAPDYALAARRVASALPTRAFWVSGTGRAEMLVTEASSEPLIVKGGAEGVYMGALPDRGIGFALKSRDGSSRGAEAALDGVLQRLGVIDGPAIDLELRNKAGDVSGEVKVTSAP